MLHAGEHKDGGDDSSEQSEQAAVKVGQWVELLVKCKISGGAVGPGVPAEQEIPILLRAYVLE